jgi:hypothetical protein
MIDKVKWMWYTVYEYKKSSTQKIILLRNNHTHTHTTPYTLYSPTANIYSITQLQKTTIKKLTTASITRIYFIMMLVEVVHNGRNV